MSLQVGAKPRNRVRASAATTIARAGRAPLTFLMDLWRSACRPAVLQRCGIVALVVGTLLSFLNQGDLIVTGRFDRVLVLRILGNYLIPFVVSNLGAMTSLPPRPERGERSHTR